MTPNPRALVDVWRAPSVCSALWPIAALFALFVGVAVVAAEPGPLAGAQALAVEAHRLRVENAQLRMTVATLRAELDEIKLTAERTALEAEIRKATNADPADVFDWAAGRFVKPSGGAK